MTNSCSNEPLPVESEMPENSRTPRTLQEALTLWEALSDRNRTIRERFQALHPQGVLLRSASLQPNWARN